MQDATVSAWCEERCYCRRVHVWVEVKRREREREGRCVAFSMYTCARGRRRWREPGNGWISAFRGRRDKAKSRARMKFCGVRTRGTIKTQQITAAIRHRINSRVFNSASPRRRTSANDILTARSRIVTKNVRDVSRHWKWITLRATREL